MIQDELFKDQSRRFRGRDQYTTFPARYLQKASPHEIKLTLSNMGPQNLPFSAGAGQIWPPPLLTFRHGPRVTFFASKCIYEQKLDNINTCWYHFTTFRYLESVFKKIVLQKIFDFSPKLSIFGRNLGVLSFLTPTAQILLHRFQL